ncbi:MAG: hypothetical protein ACOCWR_05390, partial [Oceanidesulfovibrio sp.]
MTDPVREAYIEFIEPDDSQSHFLALEKVEDAGPGAFRVFASSQSYSLRTSYRPARRLATRDILRVRELLMFDGTRMERLGYPLGGQFRHRWIGYVGPSPIIPGPGGTRIWLGSETVGVLEVQYVACFDRWEVETPHPVA